MLANHPKNYFEMVKALSMFYPVVKVEGVSCLVFKFESAFKIQQQSECVSWWVDWGGGVKSDT